MASNVPHEPARTAVLAQPEQMGASQRTQPKASTSHLNDWNLFPRVPSWAGRLAGAEAPPQVAEAYRVQDPALTCSTLEKTRITITDKTVVNAELIISAQQTFVRIERSPLNQERAGVGIIDGSSALTSLIVDGDAMAWQRVSSDGQAVAMRAEVK